MKVESWLLLKKLLMLALTGLTLRMIPGRRLAPASRRSEEHTSELQSRQYLVCRLLLEKKNHGEVGYSHGCGPWYRQWQWNIKKDVGVSAELTAGCHAIDALLWFMQRRVVEVADMKTTS